MLRHWKKNWNSYKVFIKGVIRKEWYTMYGGFLFIGCFFGIIFTLATAMIIYYKQITEGYQDKKRYEILQKVGMSSDEVKNLIDGQVKNVFYMPYLVAIIHIVFAGILVKQIIYAFGIYNLVLFTTIIISVIVLFGAAYLLIYRKTSNIYYKIVKRLL